jgi:hypothetical protein
MSYKSMFATIVNIVKLFSVLGRDRNFYRKTLLFYEANWVAGIGTYLSGEITLKILFF